MERLLTKEEREDLAKTSAERREALDREIDKAVKEFWERVQERPREKRRQAAEKK